MLLLNFSPFIVVAIFIFYGAALLLFPKIIQRWLVGFQESILGKDLAGKLNPLLSWQKSEAYIYFLRFLGCLAMGVGITILFLYLYLRASESR